MASARAQAILGRFPRHLEADAPGKLFSDVVGAIVEQLDAQTTQIGEIRRAHRLGFAREESDLYNLAGLHDLHPVDFELLSVRLDALRGLRAALTAPAATAGDLTAAFARLPSLLALSLGTFARFPGETTDKPLAGRLATAIATLVGYRSEMDLLRGRIADIIGIDRSGNGTIGALLAATASALDLEVETLQHMSDGFFHVATCRDRLRLLRVEPPGATPATTSPRPDTDLLVLEENPLRPTSIEPTPRVHARINQLFRAGFDPVPAAVTVVGVGDRTVEPMVVDVDAGHGLGFHGSVPDGQDLIFGTDGRVTLAGADVTTHAYAFDGAVFADAALAHDTDFVFADGGVGGDRGATFVVTTPVDGAFDFGFVWPRADGPVAPLTLAVGETRWALFVRAAHFGSDAAPASPLYQAAIFDDSVYLDGTGAPLDPSAKVGFDWLEHEAFAAVVWLPLRFADLDGGEGAGTATVAEQVRRLLDRHRAAGVHVYVKYADDRWLLDHGILRNADSTDVSGIVVDGTRLWPDGTSTST